MPRTRSRRSRRSITNPNNYLAHQYSVRGENLPTSPTTDKIFVPRIRATVLIAIPLFLLFDMILNLLLTFYSTVKVVGPQEAANARAAAAASSSSMAAALSASSYSAPVNTGVHTPDFSKIPLFATAIKGGKTALANCLPIVNGSIFSHALALLAAVILAWMLAQRFNYAARSVAHDQLGDGRLLEIGEIQARYPAIPEKHGTFKGYGGLPISHYKHDYYINQDTVNTLTIGTSRSGKGQTTVIQLIDNLSRAEKQSSMVINDPKGELFVASKETLEKRGYDVYVLNLDDPLQSMSYNPLQLIIDAWVRGDIESATQMINTLGHDLYPSEDQGKNKWVYEGAQHAFIAMTMSLLKYCVAHDCIEKVTMFNVADMLSQLGQLNYYVTPKDLDQTNAMDAFFQSLPPSDIAKKQYGSTSFSGKDGKGSILSTVNEGMAPFTLQKNAKMTSMNSLKLKSLGFPKSITLRFPEIMYNEILNIQFFRDKKLVTGYKVRVGANGYTEYNFDTDLTDGDIVVIRNPKDANPKHYSSYRLHFTKAHTPDGEAIFKRKTGHEQEVEMNKIVQLKPLHNGLKMRSASLYYTDKPTAVFMAIPDSDNSNHAIASTFIRQTYTELSRQARNAPGQKCTRRVHMPLDEFGNMIKIPNMAETLTVSNGRNILWDLFVQSFKQLNSLYGDADAATIKENCQVLNYIYSTDDDTVDEISNRLGNYTALAETNAKSSMMNVNESVQQNAEADAVITKERIHGLLKGESIVFDPLHREDLHGRKVRSYPIFNTQQTVMPYAYEFLKDEFNPDGDINQITVKAPHADLDLVRNSVDYTQFIVDKAGLKEYKRQQQSGQTGADLPEEGSLDDSMMTLDEYEAQEAADSVTPVVQEITDPEKIAKNDLLRIGVKENQVTDLLTLPSVQLADVQLRRYLPKDDFESRYQKGQRILSRYYNRG